MGVLRQFFIHDAIDSIAIGDELRLSEQDSHHVSNVLRLKPGATLEVIALKNKLSCTCTLSKVDSKNSSVLVESTQVIESKRAAVDTVLVSLCKAKKNDFVVEKATELGVSRIVFARTNNCEFKFHSEADRTKKLNRWELVAENAAKQSKRKSLPAIIVADSLKEALEQCSADTMRFVCSLEPNAITTGELDPILKPATLAIGPEGDFTSDEYQCFEKHSFTPLSLGEEVLRAETAVIAAIASIRAISKA